MLPYRSNVPKISEFCFVAVDPDFPARCKEKGQGIIVGGHNYGQGSSREHAALAPLYLGVKAVIAKSFARIHKANLVNAGILPLEFVSEADYDGVELGHALSICGVPAGLKAGGDLPNKQKHSSSPTAPPAAAFAVKAELSGRQIDILLAGGLLPYTKKISERQ